MCVSPSEIYSFIHSLIHIVGTCCLCAVQGAGSALGTEIGLLPTLRGAYLKKAVCTEEI